VAEGDRKSPRSLRVELKVLEIGLRGRNRPDFGTVRPRRSNPGPPTKNRIQIEVFACSVWRAGVTRRSQIFLELGGGSPVRVDFEPSIELADGYRTAVYQHAHGPRTVRDLGLKIKGAVHAGVLPAHRSGP